MQKHPSVECVYCIIVGDLGQWRCREDTKGGGFHTIAPPQRRTLPLVFAAAKTAQPCAQVTKAAVRGAQLRGFAKQTGKDGEDHGIELARIPEILRLFHPTAATITQPISINDWFLWYFL